MSSFLYRLGRSAARHRVLVLLSWIVLLTAAGGGAALFNHGTDDSFEIPGSESQQALDYLDRVFPEVSGTSAQLVVVVPEGERVETPAITSATADAVTELERLDQVVMVLNPFSDDVTGALSSDHRAAMVSVLLEVDLLNVSEETKAGITSIAEDYERAIGGGVEVYAGGDALSDRVPGLSIVEAAGLGIALVVLLVVFRSFLAAGMPLLTAVIGVGVSIGLIMLATILVPISSTAPMLAVMLGLAVGIDYALFLLARHRDQLADGIGVEESIARATATAGSAVIFAGLTVVIALLGLAVAGIPFLTTMGVAAAAAVTVAVIVAVTLIPASLAFAGDRMRPKRRRRAGRERAGFSRRWIRIVTRIPALTVVIVVAGLAVAAIPATDLRLALPDNGTEPQGNPARDTYDVITERFGPGYNGPLLVTVDVLDSNDPVGVTNEIADEIRDIEGVALVPVATPNRKGEVSVIQVVPTTAPDSPGTEELVATLRATAPHFLETYGTATAVTGITAAGIDVSAQLGDALVPFGILVIGLSLVLLAMVFRSIWVPIKATAGYLLSVGAAFGATSFVFQQGHFADALDITRTGSVISFLPIILMGVLFGLAMDYEVFLVSRIREDYVHGGDPHRAIETGFVATSRVVVAAALIMFAVFAAFVPEGSSTIKPIAFSLAVGVFVDAFLVRMTLVPAILAMLGHRAWGLSPKLDRRLPVFDAEGDALMRELRLADWPSPDSTEVVSAANLTLTDDRDHTVYRDVEIHLRTGETLVLHGPGTVGKSALLFSIAGRVPRLNGDLKVLGHVLPQHTHALRSQVAVISSTESTSPAAEAATAVDDGIELILIDDADLVLHPGQRAELCRLLDYATRTERATVVLTCQDPARIQDLLPSSGVTTLALTPQLLEAS
ncbi:MMPL family transporter [Haloechinothrix halophila]|uniref:MMPL family transporter n=1 Tax=Haloechinothrix halophila TaxID=1069073 RepID=UPI0004160BC6|nr:MMPL family transporter [Haloechinothrix halophila]